MSRVIFVMVMVAACGPARPATTDPVVVGNVAPDAAIALAPGCPAAWGLAGQACDATSRETCQYAEGTCYCGVPYPCTGVDLGPDWAKDIPPTWQCNERPPEIRADGCPGVEQTGTCFQDGQKCSYGDCCFEEVTCVSGAWAITGGGCPP